MKPVMNHVQRALANVCLLIPVCILLQSACSKGFRLNFTNQANEQIAITVNGLTRLLAPGESFETSISSRDVKVAIGDRTLSYMVPRLPRDFLDEHFSKGVNYIAVDSEGRVLALKKVKGKLIQPDQPPGFPLEPVEVSSGSGGD